LNFPFANVSDNRGCPPASQESHQYINAKNARDEDERAGPSLAMPIVVRRDCIGKNLQRQGSNRLTKAVIPKSIAESGKKERSGFTAHPGESEQNSSDDAL